MFLSSLNSRKNFATSSAAGSCHGISEKFFSKSFVLSENACSLCQIFAGLDQVLSKSNTCSRLPPSLEGDITLQ